MFDFQKQLTIGETFEQVLDEHFRLRYFVHPVARDEQRQGIDRWFASLDGGKISVEYKSDSRAHQTGNAFIETVSVDTRDIPGWVYTSKADVLVYYLPVPRTYYMIDFVALREQLPAWEQRYRQVKVKNSDYYTMGLLVPLIELVEIAFEMGEVQA